MRSTHAIQRGKMDSWQYQSFLIPVFVGYILIFLLPVLVTVKDSFTDVTKIKPIGAFCGIANYQRIFQDKKLLGGIGVSFRYAGGMLVIQNLLAIPLAVLLDRNLKTRNLLRAVFYMPATLSPLIVGFLWSFLMSSADYGLFNRLLAIFGANPVNWLGDYKIALNSILTTQVWQWTGWAMVIYLSNLQTIPTELIEAAQVEGANGVQIFFRITLPLLEPAASINAIVGLVGGLKVYDIIYSLTKGGPGYATQSMIGNLMRMGFSEGFYGRAAAYGMIFFLLVLVMSQIVMKILKKWEDAIS